MLETKEQKVKLVIRDSPVTRVLLGHLEHLVLLATTVRQARQEMLVPRAHKATLDPTVPRDSKVRRDWLAQTALREHRATMETPVTRVLLATKVLLVNLVILEAMEHLVLLVYLAQTVTQEMLEWMVTEVTKASRVSQALKEQQEQMERLAPKARPARQDQLEARVIADQSVIRVMPAPMETLVLSETKVSMEHPARRELRV